MSHHRGRKKNVLEKALAAHNRDLRHSLHKTSLLCLLVQGIQLNSQCNDPLLQAKLFSLVPRELLWISPDKLSRLLKWFVARKDHLLSAIYDKESSSNQENSSGNDEGSELDWKVSVVEMLVAILRVFGLRARLVLALNPPSFRPSREKQSVPQMSSPELKSPQSEVQKTKLEPAESSLTGESTPLPSAQFLKLMEQIKQNSAANRADPGSGVRSEEIEGDGGHTASGGGAGRGGRKRRGGKSVRGSAVKKRKVSHQTSVKEDTPEKQFQTSSEAKKSSGTVRGKGKGKRPARKSKPPTTASETSPYFGQEEVNSDSGDESDDSDFFPVKRKSSQRLNFESSDSSVSEVESDGVSGDDGETGEGGGGDKKRGRKKKMQKTERGKVVKAQPQKNQKLKDESKEQKKREDHTTQCGMYGKYLVL